MWRFIKNRELSPAMIYVLFVISLALGFVVGSI